MRQNRTIPMKNFSVDEMMWNVASSLVRDFQINLDDPDLFSDFRAAVEARNLVRVRELSAAEIGEVDGPLFKATYQLHSLMKRYRFSKDIYSDDELIEKAIQSFQDTQNRIKDLTFTDLDEITSSVIDKAKIYIANILGMYSDEEHRSLCSFGRRASVGVPARSACIAARWEPPISGSSEQISWFDSEMSQIPAIQDYWKTRKGSDLQRSTYCETSSLTLTLVPKTFKSLRAIMPNTTIGSYMSFGLGEMIRKRLKRAGYDIGVLQQRHRVLARSASQYHHLVTADLSSASDSISVQLVELLFPPDWVDILTRSRIGNVTLPNGQVVESKTFCTMGIGYTFPLQTLVFLALLKGVEATLFSRWNRRTISVYGDDMIYVVPMHNTVLHVFKELGFVINLDKTYHDGGFRESCGGDYYHGVDVRPFQPRNGAAFVGQKTYEAVLYKYINGLLMRWSEHEIGRTLLYLTDQIERITGKCKLVPCDFPDDSGIKCPTLTFWSFLQNTQCARPKHLGHGVFRFSYLRLVSEEREELRHEPYLWLALRGARVCTDQYSVANRERRGYLPSFLQSTIDQVVGVSEEASELIERELKPIMTVRSKISGRRLRRVSTFVTIGHTGRYVRQSGTSCFEDRR